MSQILIIAEHDGKTLNLATAKCVTCARALAEAKITIAVFAVDGAAVAAQAATLAGVSGVLVIDNPANEHALAAV
ncbi:MAG TPA: electron transfer flavoprotein subunit alpha/FixB family protein, partial [Steroidobacteraceae bacterium]